MSDKQFLIQYLKDSINLLELNPLKKLGDINLWVNNKSYNFVENIHQAWLITIVDLIIGKREYSA